MKRSPKPFSTEVSMKSSNNETKVENHIKFKYSKFSLSLSSSTTSSVAMRKSFWREVCCSVSCSFDWVWQSTAGKIVSHSLISANSRVEGDFRIFPPVSQHKTPHSKNERMFSRQNYLVEHRNFSPSLNIAPLHQVVPDDCFNLFSTTIIVVVHIHLTHSAPPLVSSTARVVSSES